MNRLVLLTASAALAVVVAHSLEDAPWALASLCEVSNGCVASDPKWVSKFSTPLSADGGPEQFWLNLGPTPDVMVVGWLTANTTAPSTVQYGTRSGVYTQTASGNASHYVYGALYTSGLIHHVALSNLAPRTVYYYLAAGAAQEFNFTSSPGVGADLFPYTFGTFADIGESADADSTVAHMIAGSGNIDAYILNGDISYATGCESLGCTTWDAFQRMMQPLAAFKPISIEIGNHEMADYANGIFAISSQYRFAGMPTGGRKDGTMYYSYSVGPAHVISLASFYEGGYDATSPLTVWLTADLASIDRSQTPWVIVSIHAPWYNSNSAHQGDGEGMRVAIEPLLLAAGVNAIFTGHVHSFERSLPIADNVVQPAGKGIVHFNIGDAGAGLYTTWLNPQPAWSAVRSAVFGHGELQLVNRTHALWTWHRNQDAERIIMDSYYVVNTY